MKILWWRRKIILQTQKDKIVPPLQIFLVLLLFINSGCVYLGLKKVDKVQPAPKETAVLAQPAPAADINSKTKKIRPENLFSALVYSHRAQACFLKEDYAQSWADMQHAQRLGYRFDPQFLESLKQAITKESGNR